MRLTAVPARPTIHSAPPMAIIKIAPCHARDRPSASKPVSIVFLARIEMHSTPCINPSIRMLSFMSPLKMWLNSCAITPCSCSRVRLSTAPLVTPSTASLSSYPAAKALIPGLSRMYTGGTWTPEAMDISSTTFISRTVAGSSGLSTRVPPRSFATTLPPAARSIVFNAEPIVTMHVHTATVIPNVAQRMWG